MSVTLPAGVDPSGVASVLPQLVNSLESYVRVQRWFGDKTRPIRDLAPFDFAIVPAGGDLFVLLVVGITFQDGGAAQYFLPLVLTGEAAPQPAATAVDATGKTYAVLDAFRHPPFHAWFLDLLAGASVEGARGRFAFRPTSEFAGQMKAARSGSVRLSGAEQSNTSVIYGDTLIVKALRRLQPGLHPDFEIGRFLTERTPFRHVPLVAADLTYLHQSGEQILLALAQTFVPSHGDGWSYALKELRRLSADRLDDQSVTDWLSAARLLGQRTGQLHVALAGGTDDPDFAPEPIAESDTRTWTATLRASIDQTVTALERDHARVPDEVRDDIDAFTARQALLREQAAGFDAQVGSTKTRVHGDYHLGQILRTLTDDFVILDFEGEPSRPMAERRAKTSPLKDVAGMLRSFGYARGTIVRQLGDARDPQSLDTWLAGWEGRTRAAFLDGYRDETVARGAPFVPATEPAFNRALAAWELDKAIYEVNYELNNRPDWLDIPLRAILASPSPTTD